jgi:hypothetical protein
VHLRAQSKVTGQVANEAFVADCQPFNEMNLKTTLSQRACEMNYRLLQLAALRANCHPKEAEIHSMRD